MKKTIESTLDKWLKPVEVIPETISENEIDTSVRTSIFIDIPAVYDYFQTAKMVPDYEKILMYLKEHYGDDSSITVYDGKYKKHSLSSADYTIQKEYITSLRDVGYEVRNSIKYLQNNQKIVIKGTEVTLAIDMIYYGHSTIDSYDLAVIVCGDHRKYRKLTDFVQETLGKKVKIFSFLQVYEDDHHKFLELLNNLGLKVRQTYPIDTIRVKRMSDEIKLKIKLLNPKDIRQRVKAYNTNKSACNTNTSESEDTPDTFLFIDYGNIHHSLIELRQKNAQLKYFKEVDFLLSLKHKASVRHHLKKIKLFMGMPRITIKDLDHMRAKKEQLIAQLNNHEFEVLFTINENKFTGGMKEQGVDLRIAINIIHAALENEFEKVILVSGDADFVNVVKKLRQLHKEIEIWSFTEANDTCPLSPFLYEELTKDENNKNGVKSLNAMFKC